MSINKPMNTTLVQMMIFIFSEKFCNFQQKKRPPQQVLNSERLFHLLL